MQILGLLGMYFDAVVVEVEKYLLFFSDWLWPYCGEEGSRSSQIGKSTALEKLTLSEYSD